MTTWKVRVQEGGKHCNARIKKSRAPLLPGDYILQWPLLHFWRKHVLLALLVAISWSSHNVVSRATVANKPEPPHRVFTITFRHITLGRAPLDEWSARRRDLHLTTHNNHKRRTSVPLARLKHPHPSKREAADQRLRPRGNGGDHCSVIYVKSNLRLPEL
jgi:hypothetical protein